MEKKSLPSRLSPVAKLRNTLAVTPLFAGLPESDLEDLALCCSEKTLGKGELLFLEGSPAEGFFIVKSGLVSIHRLAETGREQMIRLFSPGDSFAEAVLAGMDTYPVTARAESPATVVLVRKTELRGLIGRRPEIALRLLAALSRHLHNLVFQIEELRTCSVDQRLRQWLLARCPTPLPAIPTPISLPGTKLLLAAELGTVAETLSRSLAAFRGEGWITVEGRLITVLNPQHLARMEF